MDQYTSPPITPHPHLPDLAHSSMDPKISFSCQFGQNVIILGSLQLFFNVASLTGYRKTLFPFNFPHLLLWFLSSDSFLCFPSSCMS